MKLVFGLALGLCASAAQAGVCDYKPIAWVVSGAAVSGATATAATGAGMQAAGLYAITNATTGAAMLGSTAVGASAAGTTGILAGTSGVLGTIGGVLLAPEVLFGAAVVAIGGGAFEGGCYLAG